MKEKSWVLIGGAAAFIVVAVLLALFPPSFGFDFKVPQPRISSGGGSSNNRPNFKNTADEPEAPVVATASLTEDTALAEELLAKLMGDDAREAELLLNFKDKEALARFKARIGNSSIKFLDALGTTARVSVGSLKDLAKELGKNKDDYAGIASNFLVYVPPSPEETATQRPNGGGAKAFGDTALAFMGVSDNARWGTGVTIAIIDSGVFPHPEFGTRLAYLDVGQGRTGSISTDGSILSEDSHGTQCASLAAGASGVAPQAKILSVRVTDATGISDVFTLAKAIRLVADQRVPIASLSLGSQRNSPILTEAVAYAQERGTLIVAAGGNGQAARLDFPANLSGVLSTGSVDANGVQAYFSNSGDNLAITAPGVGINAAYPGGGYRSFSGTSASTPLVSGAVAALMSQQRLSSQNASNQLLNHTTETGAPGRDPDYGYGTADVLYALNRGNLNYTDPTVSLHHYDPKTEQFSYTIQNKSGHAQDGLIFDSNYNGDRQSVSVPPLPAGGSYVYSRTVARHLFQTTPNLTFSGQLRELSPIPDRNRQNNGRHVIYSQSP